MYKKTIFWENIKRTLAIFTGPATYAIHELNVADTWMVVAAVLFFLSGIISVWMTDMDNDGNVDIFQ
ncbi:MAG: hypothetical protein KatS3mg031_2948 [Chitinophagales bacterium]|nr:MAG: hypothetical protein KatS3mg031_2948 [Chitinophagales bacterium]